MWLKTNKSPCAPGETIEGKGVYLNQLYHKRTESSFQTGIHLLQMKAANREDKHINTSHNLKPHETNSVSLGDFGFDFGNCSPPITMLLWF